MDLFAEFKCLDMGERLGRFISQYRVNYFVPDRMNGPIVYSYKLRNGAEEQIYEKISDITISMKALDHLRMPEFISNEYPVYMNDEEAKFYADMEENLFVPLKRERLQQQMQQHFPESFFRWQMVLCIQMMATSL